MSRKKQKNYTAESKASAVKIARESEQTVAKTAESLGVNLNILHTGIY